MYIYIHVYIYIYIYIYGVTLPLRCSLLLICMDKVEALKFGWPGSCNGRGRFAFAATAIFSMATLCLRMLQQWRTGGFIIFSLSQAPRCDAFEIGRLFV